MRFGLKSILRLGCAVAAGLSVWTAIFGEIVQAIDDSLNLRVTTAEDRRQLMG